MNLSSDKPLGALILAAGMSRRMGRPKLTLPWKQSTVIESVVQAVVDASLTPVHVVLGGNKDEIVRYLKTYPVSFIVNPDFATGEMISSIKIGLGSFTTPITGAMLFLGDQPQITPGTITQIMQIFKQQKPGILIPTYQRRRGHPVVIGVENFQEILTLLPGDNLRDWISRNMDQVHYCEVEKPEILFDLDTPQDYRNLTQNNLRAE